jgi:hypothetical protein
MSRKISYFPTNENIKKEGPYPVCKIWTYGSIEIERVVGTIKDASGWTSSATRTIRYENASKASKGRLHRAVAKRVNKGEATIDFIYGDLGLGYEVEL